jgi:hemerythrin-like metal-binding protein
MEWLMFNFPVLDQPREPNYVTLRDEDRVVQFPLTGMQELDRDHIEIIRLIENISKTLTQEDFLAVSAIALNYIYHHIKVEEAFMADIKYPGLRIHQLEHQSLKGIVQTLFKQAPIEIERRNMSRNIFDIVQDSKRLFKWHIINHDLSLAKFVKYQNVSLDSYDSL